MLRLLEARGGDSALKGPITTDLTALEEYTEDRAPYQHGGASGNFARVEAKLAGEWGGGEN